MTVTVPCRPKLPLTYLLSFHSYNGNKIYMSFDIQHANLFILLHLEKLFPLFLKLWLITQIFSGNQPAWFGWCNFCVVPVCLLPCSLSMQSDHFFPAAERMEIMLFAAELWAAEVCPPPACRQTRRHRPSFQSVILTMFLGCLGPLATLSSQPLI